MVSCLLDCSNNVLIVDIDDCRQNILDSKILSDLPAQFSHKDWAVRKAALEVVIRLVKDGACPHMPLHTCFFDDEKHKMGSVRRLWN